jgi:hypothetical protein
MNLQGSNTYELRVVKTEDDWTAYHRIRREELFEARGWYGVYDSNYPDERLPNHFPLLGASRGRDRCCSLDSSRH